MRSNILVIYVQSVAWNLTEIRLTNALEFSKVLWNGCEYETFVPPLKRQCFVFYTMNTHRFRCKQRGNHSIQKCMNISVCLRFWKINYDFNLHTYTYSTRNPLKEYIVHIERPKEITISLRETTEFLFPILGDRKKIVLGR